MTDLLQERNSSGARRVGISIGVITRRGKGSTKEERITYESVETEGICGVLRVFSGHFSPPGWNEAELWPGHPKAWLGLFYSVAFSIVCVRKPPTPSKSMNEVTKIEVSASGEVRGWIQ